MAATLSFDGMPDRGTAGDLSAQATAGRTDRGPKPPVPPVALAVAFVTLLLFHAGGLRWRDGLAMSLLVFVIVLVWAGATARRPVAVYVVGSEAFGRRVTGAAGGSRRITGQWRIDAAGAAPPPQDLLARLRSVDELVVEARCFTTVLDRIDLTSQFDGRVRVVTDGMPADELFSSPLGVGPRIFKRAFDIVFSLVALLLVAPCLLVAALAIRLDSRGPALFRQMRVGEGGRRFTFYKLRTMTVGEEDPAVLSYMADMVRCQAEPENGLFKLGSNRRITRVGKLLRRLSVDEVPQLLNVLKGDMSLVGPRPPILEEAACYDDFHWQRLAIRPGITGLAQVNGRSRLRFDEIVALDVRYSRSWSLLMELKIVLRTPAAVLSGRGAT